VLAGYDWDTPRPDIHNGRAVLVIHARLAENPPLEAGETDDPKAETV
jgi:hypothetical protein